jgi:hypothetical protein
MQLASGSHIPDGLLAANALLSEKLHQGFAAPKSTLHQGFGVSISSTPLGIISPLYDDGIGSRYTGKERDSESGNDYFNAPSNNAFVSWLHDMKACVVDVGLATAANDLNPIPSLSAMGLLGSTQSATDSLRRSQSETRRGDYRRRQANALAMVGSSLCHCRRCHSVFLV